ncbi:MAG TPA: hypothetical protein PKL14_02160 [Holophaga sp.]|nr:hypothetical protein [Holophaga sp.]
MPALLNYQNFWAGNTGGKGGVDSNADVISNFVVDLGVLNASQLDWQAAPYAPLVVTKSYWDETRWADGAYSKGARFSKGEYFNSKMVFDTTTRGSLTATIAHPQKPDASQQNLEDQGCPLTAAYASNPPYVSFSDGRTLTSVAYPTNVAFDNNGYLWVADNGPEQNFKIFSVPATGAPTLINTFGEAGGVFAGPRPGAWGEKRFWGLRGVCFPDNGQIIVGCSGIPGQIQGGTDIRWFDSSDASTLAKRLSTATMTHQAIGSFTHVADFDPAGNGTELHHATLHYTMDYSKPTQQGWKISGVTLDPFRFPQDPRLSMPLESTFVRRIDGKKFLYGMSMNASYLAIFRFEENSEIAIPAGLVYLFDNGRHATWGADVRPANLSGNVMWIDKNGDGAPQADEFSGFDVANPYSEGYDVDANGNIWMAGGNDAYSTYWKAGGSWVLPCQGLDTHGIPQYDGNKIERLGVGAGVLLAPDIEISRSATRLRYLADTDTLLLGAGMDPYCTRRVYVIDGYRTSATPTRRCVIDLGFDDLGAWGVHLDYGTASMVLPATFAADKDFLYVACLDGGRDAHMRGEVTIYSLQDGHEIGWILPDTDTNHTCGAIDLNVGIQVATQSDGTRLICLEDNGGGKFMVYRWTPPVQGLYPSTTGSNATGPVIVSQPPKLCHPLDQSTLDLRVYALGTGLNYQWYQDGLAISGATSAILHKGNLTAADAGSYTVKVFNTAASLTSTATAVSLVYPAVITVQPQPTTSLTAGSPFTLSVTATSPAADDVLFYQWYKGADAIPNADKSTYTVAAAVPADAGIYTVVVKNYSQAALDYVSKITSANAVIQIK